MTRTQRNREIVALARKGVLFGAVAGRFGLTIGHASSIARAGGVCRQAAKGAATAERNARIVAEARAGLRYKTVAERHGIGIASISQIALQHGVRRKKRLTGVLAARRNRKIAAAAARGEPYGGIAAAFDLSRSAVSNIACAAGVRCGWPHASAQAVAAEKAARGSAGSVPGSVPWSRAHEAELARDWFHKSATAIAVGLGRTRNEVIGKAYRMGLKKAKTRSAKMNGHAGSGVATP